MAGLLSLPDELITQILVLGGHLAIVACQQTCRRVYDLVKGSMALQYVLSLAAAGLIENIPMSVKLVQRVRLLAAHETAWKDSPWFPMEGYDGILGLAASSGNLLVFFRLWNDSIRFGRSLVFQTLPSVHQGVPDFSARMDPDFHMNEFCIDSSQDLLIYAHGNRLVTREVGTNRPHPASRAGILSLRPNELPISTTTRVYGELAACLTTFIDDGSLRFRVFNWMTGALITESGGNFSPLRYEFLDADHIFYSSSEALTNYPNLVVENIHTSCRTILGLDFPDVAPGTKLSCYLSIPQNSMPHTRTTNGNGKGHWHSATSTATAAGASAGGYFCADLTDRLVVLNVVSYGWGGYHSCVKQQQTLHVSANALLSYVRAHPSGGFVAWDAWTPGNVRVVPRREVAHETVTGMHSLCGMRALSEHIVHDAHARPVVCVYDYHRGRVAKALAGRGHGHGHGQEQGSGISSSSTEAASSGGAGVWTRTRHSLATKRQEPLVAAAATSYVLAGGGNEMPCLVKEIPIPEGLLVRNLMCVLCEHAVVLLELSDRRLGAPISGVYYHAI